MTMAHERQDDIPVEIDAELVRCATDNGRISLNYLRDLWLRGFDHGHVQGYISGLDEVHGDPKVEQIEAGFEALLSATGGEYSTEDHIVIGALTAAREFAVRLARLEASSALTAGVPLNIDAMVNGPSE